VTPEEFKTLGHALVDWIADYRARIESLPVMSPAAPGDVLRQLPAVAPEAPEGLSAILAELERTILPGITHWNHPSFFAYFPSNTLLASVLADLVASGLGPQAMSWQTSPAATELEERVMDWLREALGLDPGFSGVIQDTASTATLTALLCARERSTGFAQNAAGLQGRTAALTVYASEEAHSSVQKAALLAGFGKANLRLIETDGELALRPARLREAIALDQRQGLVPSAIVACVGTTATTAIDPLAEIAPIAKEHGLWLHVDAAMAGSAMILPECRWMWAGIESADSLVLNPHKWLGAGFDLSAYYVRDPEHLVRVMSTNPSYLHTAQDGVVRNLRDWGIPLGRRFRALKLWFVIKEQGLSGLRARLRRDIDNARWLAAQVDAAPDWQRTAPVHLQTVCLRHQLVAATEDMLARHNLEIARRINAGGRAYLTPALVKGRQILRVSIGAEGTERRHVEALWEALRMEAGRAAASA
jgi:aromatic-L-amino-acid decarboxylase